MKTSILPKTFQYSQFNANALSSGLYFNNILCLRFISALLTKPFVILTGLSGSGKTKLAQAFSMWICDKEEDIMGKQYCIVPVGADWTNREHLLGFPNALEINSYVKPDNGVLDLIIDANKNKEKPYFLILDEMNLSHVERYFADFLSVMESKTEIALHSGKDEWNGVPAKIGFPSNLFIIGTVNIDETTYMFSPKVLDRANVIEFRVTIEEMAKYLTDFSEVNLNNLKGMGKDMANNFLQLALEKHKIENEKAKNHITESLNNFFIELKKCGAEFGYRSAFEIIRFAGVAKKLAANWNEDDIIDAAIMQKLLPKVHGSRRKLEPVLKKLGTLCLQNDEKMEDYISKYEIDYTERSKIKYPVSLEKILRMYQNLINNGFTSYAEA
jgi:5-methylcytosine-specific restriction protein B